MNCFVNTFETSKMLPRGPQQASWTPFGSLREPLGAPSCPQRIPKRHLKRPKELVSGPQGIAKACPRDPKTFPKVSKWSPSGPRGIPKGSQDSPRRPQGTPKGSPRVPKGSPRATGRLRSRWNDGVAPKSAALRTSCERRVEPCLHARRLSTSLTSWYDFSHTLRGLDRRNPRKLPTVQHFSMVSMVLR